MADYYSLLERKIKETLDDPAKVRQVVYEAARLALKRQVLVQQPPIAVRETWRLLNDLEDAITRCEADWAESDRQKSTNLKARETRDNASRPRRSYGEADEAAAGIERAAREDRTAGGTHAPRPDGRYAFKESEADEARARPTPDRRTRSGPRSGPHATHRDDRGPTDLDEAVAARATRAAREGGQASAAYAHRTNGRSPVAESEEDDARPAPARPRYDRWRSDPQSGLRAADHDDRGPIDLDEDGGAGTNQATRDWRKASGTYAPRPSGRSRFAESENEAEVRPRNDRRMRGDPGSVEALRADDDDSPTSRDEDGASVPLEPQVEEPPNRPRNRFRDSSRELVLIPSRSSYVVRPDDFPPSTDIIYEAPPDPVKVVVPMLWSAARVVFQVAVAVLAASAFYVTVWQRNIGERTQDPPATIARDKGPPAGPNNAAPATGSSGAGETVTTATSAALATAPLQAPVAPAFSYPSSYGIYAISGNELIELEQIPTASVDPRTRTTLQIVKPSRTVIPDAHLTFIAYRRDFLSTAPEKVPVRIAARIAHSMIFDSSGKPVITTPENETWLIREKGYDLRVSPVRENAEMVTLRPETPDLAFPAGRYELLLGGQYYDFTIAGNVTDPSQCVEGFATVRGPAFYECKTQ